MCRIAAATIIVLLGATLINWLRSGATFHIAKAFPLLGGFEISIYDLAGGVMLLIAILGVARLFRKEDYA